MTKLGEINNQTEMYDKSEVDGIISALPTGGDMLKSAYDTNNDGIINKADVITNQGDLATLDSVNTAQITNSAVTNTKLAHMNANTLKGRLSGDGTPQDVAMADLPISTATQTALNGKQNILSEGAFVDGDKTKLDGIEAGAEVNAVDSVNGRTGVVTGLAEDNEVVKLTGNQTIAGVKTFEKELALKHLTTPANPASGYNKLYFKADGKLYYLNSAGVETEVGGGGGPQKLRITIPGELIADTSNYQGLYFKNESGSDWTISNVAIAVGINASGTGAACAVNLYKSSGTEADGINTSATALFASAVDLGATYSSLTNTPNTTIVENGRWLSLRITSSAGATRRGSDMQVVITLA